MRPRSNVQDASGYEPDGAMHASVAAEYIHV